jgi:hypothetical protein
MAKTELEEHGEAVRRQIAERAYALWEAEDRPHGRDLDHWLRAEAEITNAGIVERAAAAASARPSRKPPKSKSPETRVGGAPSPD